MENELFTPGPLLCQDGSLAQIGWARWPLLDGNLEQAAFYPPLFRPFQALRVKRWDYYALFTPRRFFSATVANLGYAANVFVYLLDFTTGELFEQGLVLPAWTARLPRSSCSGETVYEGKEAHLRFRTDENSRQIHVNWPAFKLGADQRGICADLELTVAPGHESMNIVIPIRGRRFYYNTKINCLPAKGLLLTSEQREEVLPDQSLASLDWGRGVWEYRSYWNWASTSGFLPDGRTLGLNLGRGFGDTSRATENALILNGKIHKLGAVTFDYSPSSYRQPWHFRDEAGRLDLTFTPFQERVARSNLLVIFSEVHQMFGRYSGIVKADDGEVIEVKDQIGFAEEHRARW